MKKILSEQQLYSIIKTSVKRILREMEEQKMDDSGVDESGMKEETFCFKGQTENDFMDIVSFCEEHPGAACKFDKSGYDFVLKVNDYPAYMEEFEHDLEKVTSRFEEISEEEYDNWTVRRNGEYDSYDSMADDAEAEYMRLKDPDNFEYGDEGDMRDDDINDY